MKINDLATSFLEIRARRNEKIRHIDYVFPNTIKALEKNDFSIENNARIINVKDQIEFYKQQVEQDNEELKYVEQELTPLLVEVGVTQAKPLITHIRDNTFSSVWLDEDRRIQGIDRFTQL